MIQPLLLGGLIRYFVAGSGVTRDDAWLYAGGVSFCAVLLAITHHPYFFSVQRIGMRMRVACCSLMYRKVSYILIEYTINNICKILITQWSISGFVTLDKGVSQKWTNKILEILLIVVCFRSS